MKIRSNLRGLNDTYFSTAQRDDLYHNLVRDRLASVIPLKLFADQLVEQGVIDGCEVWLPRPLYGWA